MYSDDFHSIDGSIMIHNVTIWYVHDRSLRNPVCLYRSWMSTESVVWFRNTLLKTFTGSDSHLLPLWFSHFLDIWMSCPYFQSVTLVPPPKSSWRESEACLQLLPCPTLMLQCFRWNIFGFFCFPTLHSIDGHPNFCDYWLSDIDRKVCMCYFDV